MSPRIWLKSPVSPLFCHISSLGAKSCSLSKLRLVRPLKQQSQIITAPKIIAMTAAMIAMYRKMPLLEDVGVGRGVGVRRGVGVGRGAGVGRGVGVGNGSGDGGVGVGSGVGVGLGGVGLGGVGVGGVGTGLYGVVLLVNAMLLRELPDT